MIVLDIANIPNMGNLSDNRRYYKKSFTLRTEYKSLKNLILYNMLNVKISPPYSVTIIIDGYIDIGNPIKLLLDALEKKGIIDNDKNIEELHIYKTAIPRGKPGKLFIEVDQL